MAAIEGWKQLSSVAFLKAIVTPAALMALAVLFSVHGYTILFYYSERCIGRLYERVGLMCDPHTNTFF